MLRNLNFGKGRAQAIATVTSAAKSVMTLSWAALVIACVALFVAIVRGRP